jgi:anti-sigma B factor antagonist
MDEAAWRHVVAREFRIEQKLSWHGTVVLAVAGDVDLYVAGELKDRLAEAADSGTKTLVLDFTEVTFVDSMGLGVLVGGMKQLRAVGGELQLVVSSPEVQRILEITRMDRVIPLHETLADALAAVGYRGSAEA